MACKAGNTGDLTHTHRTYTSLVLIGMAYVDPTGGGILLQLLLGGSAVLFIVRRFLGETIRRIVRRGRPEDEDPR